jgi:penicillin-binding protein 2
LVFEKVGINDANKNYQVVTAIGKILDLGVEDEDELFNRINGLSVGEVLLIKDNLAWTELVALEVNIYDLQGASIKTGFSRLYPYGSIASHIIGYLGSASDKDITKHSMTLYPNLKIGKNGVEKTQEKLLQGITGVQKIEVNARGKIIKEVSTLASAPGKDIKISLDINLQRKIDKLLGDQTGVILASKISSGDIIAAVSKPEFNLNLFNNGISTSNWNKLLNDPELPLINRVVSLTYPPGSGFKINAAVAALKQGFNPDTTFTCPGYHVVGDRVFRCWKSTGHGKINLYQAIAGSCNVYFWNIARIIGVQPIADTARQMGYGSQLLNGELPREQEGIIPDADWKKMVIGSNWTLADTINTVIGQGYVEATPIQILTMVTRIASGKQMVPSFINSLENKEFSSLGLDSELKIVQKGMEMAVNAPGGTAYRHRIIDPNLAMAGKTGTCQVISKRYKNDDLSKENVMKKIRNHGIFVAYAPLVKPEYAFCGIIEHGGFPSLAIKIANEVLTEAQVKNF